LRPRQAHAPQAPDPQPEGLVSDYERDRIRRAARGDWTPAVGPGSPGADHWIGTLTSTTGLATGKFLWVDRKPITGDEAEGGGATIGAARGRQQVYFTGPRVPAVGEDYVVRWVRDRWVARTGKQPGSVIEKGNGGPPWPDVMWVTCDSHTAQMNRYFQSGTWRGEVTVDRDCTDWWLCGPKSTTLLSVQLACSGTFDFVPFYQFGIGTRQCNPEPKVWYHTDTWKASADIILLEKSLLILEEGVLLGRQTYGNTIKDIKMTARMWHIFGADSPERQSLFQSGWFIEWLLYQTLIIHMIRTAKTPFFQSTAAAPLAALTLCVMLAGVTVPFSPLGQAVGLQPLPFAYLPWLVATLLGYGLLTQVVKRWYVRRFGMWL